ncbi:MAG TPA: hypothetical protein VNO79_05920 [Actinomycetota bacterium]|nr:hypothetical protein [Actinomycetota bacterium]
MGERTEAEEGGGWAVFRWQGMFFRTRDPARPEAPVEVFEEGRWRPTELLAVGLQGIGAERMDDEEVRRLGLDR